MGQELTERPDHGPRVQQRADPGPRVIAHERAELDPPADYLILVNRAWKRGPTGTGYQVFRCVLREWLPCIPVPLKEGEAEVPLDLQYVVNRAFAGGPYLRGAVDYSRAPDPPLKARDRAWADECIRAQGLLATESATHPSQTQP